MALQPTLQLISVADDASSITVKEITGNYSVSNPGGFEAPNPPQAGITGVIIGLYAFSSPDIIVPYRLSGIINLFSAGETLLASSFPGLSAGTIFPDKVYGLKYNILYTGTGSITFTGSAKQFTLTNASTVFADAIGFVLPDNTSKIYYIDRTKTLDAAGGWVTESLPVTGVTVAFEVIYVGDLMILVDKAGARCLTEDIAIWADTGCQDANFKDIWKRYKQQIALKSKFSQNYLNDANMLVTSLATYCDCLTPSTPCNC
jgi:hypothetical protein